MKKKTAKGKDSKRHNSEVYKARTVFRNYRRIL